MTLLWLFIQYACVVVAGLLHYLYTAAFFWMLCEGIMLFFKVVLTFSRVSKYLSDKWWFFFLIGWGMCFVLSLIIFFSLHRYYVIQVSQLFQLLSLLESYMNSMAMIASKDSFNNLIHIIICIVYI